MRGIPRIRGSGRTVVDLTAKIRLWDMCRYSIGKHSSLNVRIAMAIRNKRQALYEQRSFCWCERCDQAVNNGMRTRMSVCPECGDKRCPRSADHRNECSKA